MGDQIPELDYHDPEWAADRLGLDRNTVYKYLQDGTIPAVQLGRKWLISERRLAEWLEQQARDQTEARRAAAASADRTASRLTNLAANARQAVRLAHAEARRYAHTYLGQEHLLLAFAHDGRCAAARALAALGVGGDRLRDEVERRCPPGNATPPRRLARTPRAKRAMRLAAEFAAEDSAAHVDTGHLLLGLLATGEGVGFDILAALGVDLDRARAALTDLPTAKEGVRP